MKCCSSCAQPSSPAVSANALAPSSPHSERCRWKPEPASPLNGLPMNVASRPSRVARSLTAALKRNARSAASSAAECVRLISHWLMPYSWAAADHAEAGVVQREQHAVEHAARIGVVADRVDVRRILDVARPAAGRANRCARAGRTRARGPSPGSGRGPRSLRWRASAHRAGRRRRARRRPTGRTGTRPPPAPTAAARASRAAARRGCRGSRARSRTRRCGGGRPSRSPCRTPSPWAATVDAKTPIGTSLPRSTPCRSG